MSLKIVVNAVLFDLDGVLIAAKQIHRDSFSRALNQVCNIELSQERIIELEAMTTKDKLKSLVDCGEISNNVSGRIWELKQKFTTDAIQTFIKYDDEKIKMHQWLQAHNVKSVCVTNSIRSSSEEMLSLSGQLEFIDFIVSNQDVNNPKPCCEGYIRAMVRLGLNPDQVLIVEDSPKGLTAAYNTGAHVWKVNDAEDVTLERLKVVLAALERVT